MQRAPEDLSPRLPVGTQVAAWRVEAWQGQGAYGAVYRAVPVGQESAGPVALKVAHYPWDTRFAREAELLARMRHPSIPRLVGRGMLRHASGAEHPFFAMEWVEGTPLYTWAMQHAHSFRPMCLLLAQLARALEALHAAGAVHRDVKGDNILVRLSDNLPVLIDFGSGHFQGAPRLTWQSLPPSTPPYLSAQACLFDIRLVRNRDSYYPPSPADDLFALGVTAYRMVMGEYPPPMDAQEDESGGWRVTSPDPRPLLERNPRVEPLLREWILRLLSDAPEARGTAAQLAEALEAAAQESVPLKVPAPTLPARLPERSSSPAPERAWAPWLALAAAGVAALLLWPWQPVPVWPEHVSASPPKAVESSAPDAGTAATGAPAPAEPATSAPPPSEKKPLSQEPPPGPRPEQTRPDRKGRCPGGTQVLINGGCWVEQPQMSAKHCVENGYAILNGKCYTPSFAPPEQPLPTSSPAK